MLQNVKTTVKGKKLTIEIDLAKRFGQSKSGKSDIIATAAGNVDIGDGIKLGLNCYVASS
ncbi:hypothetical protein LCGC14_2428550 [marine sediment metagenome]|uniref:Uncharacterized protein n=1 Tax=marine sediment metagenome TaxID=412755 RepID=A0A0F9C9X1_9ZZZZ